MQSVNAEYGKPLADDLPILSFGEPLVVFVHSGRDGIAKERHFHADCAGAELNTAIGLARLGLPVVFSAAVGDDSFGEFLLRELRAEGIDVSPVTTVPHSQTGVFFKMNTGLQRDPRIDYYRSTSPMASGEWEAESCVRMTKSELFSWVHTTGITRMVSTPTRIEADRILHAALEIGIPISFDINIRLKMGDVASWRQNLQDVLPLITWLFLGDTEAKLLYNTGDAQHVYAKLLHSGFSGHGLVIKQGESGATAVTTDNMYHTDAVHVPQVVDTVGAGDGFNAGFIAWIRAGWTVENALTLGSLIGAHAVTSEGDSSGYPTWSTVKQHLFDENEVLR